MRKIILKLIDIGTIGVLCIMVINIIFWVIVVYFPKYLPRDPITISVSKTMQDGEIISERFIKGTSIKHGITKIFDKKGNLIGITNYNYGVLQEQIYLVPKENAKKI